MANGKWKKGENLKLFQKNVRSMIYYLYGEVRCREGYKNNLVKIYRRSRSENVKKEMILSLYRILVIESRPHHRGAHAAIAMRIDNHLTGVNIE